MTSPIFRLWGWPIALGLLIASGLTTALVSDGWGDAWSWLALGLPVVVMAWYGLRRSGEVAKPSDPRHLSRETQ